MKKEIREIVEQYAAEVKEEAEGLLEVLGRIPAPSHQEDARAEFCRDWLLAHGAEDISVDSAKNVICKIGCDDSRELVVFMAHMDIVFPDTEPLAMKKEGRRLYAPGIGDDTSNLVNLLMACRCLLERRPKLKMGILVVANSCEEGLGNLKGCRQIFADYGSRIQAFYSFDGYLSQCTSCAVGSYRYQVRVKAEGGHSYLDFGNCNAIAVLADLVGKIYRMEVPAQEKTTYNVGRFEGGTTVNSIAEEAVLLFEFRSSSQDCLKQMDERFTKLVESCTGDGFEMDTKLLGIRPGNGRLDQEALARYTAKSVEIIREFYSGRIDDGPYSPDANIPLSMGIMGNTIGTVSGGNAHTREEWVDLDSLHTGLKIALSLMLSYTSLGGQEQ